MSWRGFKKVIERLPQSMSISDNNKGDVQVVSYFNTVDELLKFLKGFVKQAENYTNNNIEAIKLQQQICSSIAKISSSDRTVQDYITKVTKDLDILKQHILPHMNNIEKEVIQKLNGLLKYFDSLKKISTKLKHKCQDVARYKKSVQKYKLSNNETELKKYTALLEEAQESYDNINEKCKQDLPYFNNNIKKVLEQGRNLFDFYSGQINKVFLEHSRNNINSSETQFIEYCSEMSDRLQGLANKNKSINSKTSSSTTFATKVRTMDFKKKQTHDLGRKTVDSLKIKRDPPKTLTCVAMYDYEAQTQGDLSFKEGDSIKIIKKSDSIDDWWTGELNGEVGVFPANYVEMQ